MRSEASACDVPYHRCGVAAGELRTNTVPKKRRNDKKSKKSVSLISDTCGCGKISQPYSCGINVTSRGEKDGRNKKKWDEQGSVLESD